MVSTPTVWLNGRLHAPAVPGASAYVTQGGRIVYVGHDDGARSFASGAREVDLQDRFVTPAFVDAHVHTIQTGQVMAGLDLGGATSRDAVLEAVAGYVAEHGPEVVVVGQGWDERHWADPRPPLRTELDNAGAGAVVYLARVDVHSAIVSTALLDRLPGVADEAGFDADGWVTQEAHHRCRRQVDSLFSDAQRRGFAATALARAASAGIATIHELGGPHLGPFEDLGRVTDAGADLGLAVITYWGEQADDTVLADTAAAGVRGLAGDLCVDGAIGSRTASMIECYADHDGYGVRYLDADQIIDHLVRCTRAGVQAGFHCIGDDAVAATVEGLRRTASLLGASAVRAVRHRLEHLEMVSPTDMATLAELGVAASMQPGFDAAWGGPGELYEQRLGLTRAALMNRVAALHRAGVPLAFGSDSPVTPLAGWETVRAAVNHWQPDERLDVATAFDAATRSAARAGLEDDLGLIAVGQQARLAVWDDSELRDRSMDDRDLPDLTGGVAPPRCVATLAGDRVLHTDDSLGGLVDGPVADARR